MTNDRPIVTRKGEGSANTGQSGGLKLMTGVGPQNTPATRLWFGTAGNPPGFRSLRSPAAAGAIHLPSPGQGPGARPVTPSASGARVERRRD